MQLSVLPLLTDRKEEDFDIFETLLEALEKNNAILEDQDVLVISTKFVSNSQGRLVNLEKINPSEEGLKISKSFQLKSEIAEIIITDCKGFSIFIFF